MKNIKYLIIYPDIHGRNYWTNSIMKYKDNSDYGFIFLGDYFDPYQDIDKITEKQTIKNWKHLKETLWNHPRTIFLLGNHDVHYLPWLKNIYNFWYRNRRSVNYYDYISKEITDNLDQFKIAYEHNVNGKRYIFTHAGITMGWVKSLLNYLYDVYKKDPTNPSILNPFNFSNFKEVEIDTLIPIDNDITVEPIKVLDNNITYINGYNSEFLNQLIYNEKFRQFLWCISTFRGGDSIDGSCIWADINEHIDYEFIYNMDDFKQHNIYQIFGHTYAKQEIITTNFAMLDCKSPFILNCETEELIKIS